MRGVQIENRPALAHHTTYAELQKQETAEMIEPIRSPPEYRKAGGREAEKIKPLEDEYKRTAAELLKR